MEIWPTISIKSWWSNPLGSSFFIYFPQLLLGNLVKKPLEETACRNNMYDYLWSTTSIVKI